MGFFDRTTYVTHTHHHVHHLDQPMAEALNKMTAGLGLIQQTLGKLMIDTSKLLAAVAREKTDNDSLRALVSANTAAMQQLSDELKAAIAAGDPAAMTAVQADLDKAATDLSLDSDKTEAALAASVPPAPATSPATPAAASPPAAPDASAPATPLPGTANPS